MKKLIVSLLLLSPLVYAGATRYIDADAIKSSDHTKTWTLPNQSDTLTGKTTSDVLTNKSMSGSTNTFTNIPASTALTGIVPIANGGTNSSSALANSKVMVSTGGAVVESSTTTTQLGFLDATSSIQTQLNAKEPTITVLPVSKGGTNSGSALQNGRVVISSGGTIGEMSLPGVSSQILTSNGASNPTWQTNAPVATNITGTLPYNHGGTGQSSSFTQYGTFTASDTSTMSQVGPGTSGYILTSAGVGGQPSYQQFNLGSSNYVGILPVANGGTNSQIALNNNRVIVSSGGTIGELSLSGTSGQILTSNGVAQPSWQTNAPSAANITGTIGYSQLTSAGAYTVLGNNFGQTKSVAAGQTIVLGTPGFSDSGALFQITGSSTSYQQGVIQNTSNAAAASSDFIVGNDSATATTFYGDFGINSSGFTGSGSLNKPNATYLYGQSGDLVLATKGINNIHMVVNSGSTDALIVDTSNKLIFPGMTGYLFGNGSSEITASSTVPFSSVTGTVPVAQGGTNSTIALNNNRVMVSSGGTIGELNFAGTSGQVLTSNGTSSLPSWQAAAGGMSNPMTTTGDIIYSSSGTTPARLGIGSGNSVLTVSGGLPSWQPLTGNPVAATVYLAANLAVTANNAIVYDTVLSDTNSAYSISTGKYTIPVTGWYYVSATTGVNTTVGVYVKKNSTKLSYISVPTALIIDNGSILVNAVAGDTIEIDPDGNFTASGSAAPYNTSFHIALIGTNINASSVQSVTSATNMVCGGVYLADTTSGSFNMTLPTPASGCNITIKDPKGKFGTNKLSVVRHGSEKIDVVAATQVLAGSSMAQMYTSDGTDWFSLYKPNYMAARYHGTTSPLLSALGTILFTTLDYDLNTNCTSGVCTIVAPGTYHVGSGLLTTASTVAVSTTISIGILKNGAIYSQRDVWPYTAAASKPASVTIDDEVVLATGDTVCIQASSNGTTPSITNTATKNYFYIKRIGD